MVPPPTLLERAIGARIRLGSIGTGAQAVEAWERNAAVEAALEDEEAALMRQVEAVEEAS